MKVLLIGSGGREHALAWRLSESTQCEKLYCAPGNAGITEHADCVDIAADNVAALVNFSKNNDIDFVVVGPEAPLVTGLVDALEDANIPAFGPNQAAAQLEGSKGFMKDLCARYDIPTAGYGRFTDITEAGTFIRQQALPVVIKTDGLAAGKGVIIAQTHEEAIEAAESMLSGDSFGDAGAEIVVEEFLDGVEASFFALCDGGNFVSFGSAQDYKRVGDGDTGLNTGGMGTVSPAPYMTSELQRKIEERIIAPTLKGMKQDGCPFRGVLFAGIMIINNEPYLLEFNVRFGDPECQSLMMRFSGDLLAGLYACTTGDLDTARTALTLSDDTAVCVVMATKGYPGTYPKNTPLDINGSDNLPDIKVLHAGTGTDTNGDLVSTGGRVLGVTARGSTKQKARDRAYKAVTRIDWPEGFYRSDIAADDDFSENNRLASISC